MTAVDVTTAPGPRPGAVPVPSEVERAWTVAYLVTADSPLAAASVARAVLRCSADTSTGASLAATTLTEASLTPDAGLFVEGDLLVETFWRLPVPSRLAWWVQVVEGQPALVASGLLGWPLHEVLEITEMASRTLESVASPAELVERIAASMPTADAAWLTSKVEERSHIPLPSASPADWARPWDSDGVAGTARPWATGTRLRATDDAEWAAFSAGAADLGGAAPRGRRRPGRAKGAVAPARPPTGPRASAAPGAPGGVPVPQRGAGAPSRPRSAKRVATVGMAGVSAGAAALALGIGWVSQGHATTPASTASIPSAAPGDAHVAAAVSSALGRMRTSGPLARRSPAAPSAGSAASGPTTAAPAGAGSAGAGAAGVEVASAGSDTPTPGAPAPRPQTGQAAPAAGVTTGSPSRGASGATSGRSSAAPDAAPAGAATPGGVQAAPATSSPVAAPTATASAPVATASPAPATTRSSDPASTSAPASDETSASTPSSSPTTSSTTKSSPASSSSSSPTPPTPSAPTAPTYTVPAYTAP